MKKPLAAASRNPKRFPAYRNAKLPSARRVKDLLSRMSLEEKAAQMVCIWREKAKTLVDEDGKFDYAKAKAAFTRGHGLGQVGRPSDAGSGKNAREMAQLTNAIQKFFVEESRLGIPVIFHEECLHGHAAVDGTSFPQPIAFKNEPWIALSLATVFYFAAISIRGSVMLPFFKYCAGNEMLFSWFNGFGLTALLVGVAVSNSLATRIGKRNLFVLSMVLTAIFAVLLVFLPPSATVAIFASEILRQFAFGWSCPLLWAMIADVADYGEWKTGRRATATVTAAVVFALWAGLALGGALAGWLFSSYGYVPNASQTARSLLGIRMTASVYASLGFAATAGCLLFYAITKEANRKIADDLDERRKKYASAMA